MNIRLCFSH